MLDVVEDHFEVLVVEGGSRSAESSCERWCHVIVSPSRSARLRCWSRCFPHRLQGWTCSRLMMQYHDVRENQILALYVCLCLIPRVSPFYREHAWRDCLHTSRVSPFYLKNQVLLANIFTNNLLWMGRFSFLHKNTFRLHGFSPFDHRLDWVWIGLVWKIQHEVLLQKTVERAFQLAVEPDWSFPLVQLWSCFNEIFGGRRGDKYRLSYNISPVFNLSTFKIQWAGSVPWRIIAFDRVW